MHIRLFTWLLSLSVLCYANVASARDVRVHILYSTQSEVFLQFVHDLRLQATPNIRITAAAVSDPPLWTVPVEAEIVIAVGGPALQSYALSERRVPVLAVLVSRLAFELTATTLQNNRVAVSAIYQDPPALRQLRLATLLMPNAHRVGFLHQTRDSAVITALNNEAKTLDLDLQSESLSAPDQLSSALTRVLARSDFLLTSADSVIYNSTTIKLLLTATYHADKVLIGSSPALVKAGSLATTYSSTVHIAHQTVDWLQKWPDSKGSIAAPVYPSYFDISINTDVARSLNIALPSNEKLLQQLIDLERAP